MVLSVLLSCPAVATQWVARYNGLAEADEQARDMAMDEAGNIYVTGSIKDVGDDDFLTVKYDPDGNELWTVRYNGPSGAEDKALAILLDPSGHPVVAGKVFGTNGAIDYATVKYDADGNELWAVFYDGQAPGRDIPVGLAVDAFGNLYVTGTSEGLGEDDYATLKYDASGNLLWTQRYHRPANGDDAAPVMVLDSAGNVYVAGRSREFGTGDDFVTIKYGTCMAVSECDDHNDCTLDACQDSFCVNDFTAMWGVSCDDGDACTGNDSCAYGVCGGRGVDADGDGYTEKSCPGGHDCDDSNPNVNPEAVEGNAADPVCSDGLDNDCDGYKDLKDPDCACLDADGDGYGDPSGASCVYGGGDCDDSDSAINPGAEELCGNQIDDNCDGRIDPSWPCTASAVSSSVCSADAAEELRSNVCGMAVLILLPLGVLVRLRAVRSKRQTWPGAGPASLRSGAGPVGVGACRNSPRAGD